MLYREQLSEPDNVRTAAAWVVRNRVATGYRGFTTYRAQVESGEFAYLTIEEANALTGQDLQYFNDLLTIARGVIDGSKNNPMKTEINDAIFFANSKYNDSGQQAGYEALLNDVNGCAGPGNWDFFEGVLGRFYYYHNRPGIYPCSIPFPPVSTPTPTPG